jgi:hypothetical protein
MSTLFGGSLCLTDIMEKAKSGHSAFSKANNGKIYFNVNIWLNDQPDKFDNVISVQLNSKKDMKEQEGKVYIGNAKPIKAAEPAAVAASDIEEFGDLPF